MRKLIPLIFISIFIFTTLALSETSIPAPFGKAKELALKATPDKDGDYIYKGEFSENGVQITFGFCWIVSEDLIGMWRSGFGAIAYDAKEDKFYVVFYGSMVEIERGKAIEAAFKIFRELVSRNLI